ncbi:MAG TPA: hypothetical protein VFV38_20895 [Ktedonobacteraceae bacterium]|nr:hypothetical protein [Ktedonobacteraceae bacterium]
MLPKCPLEFVLEATAAAKAKTTAAAKARATATAKTTAAAKAKTTAATRSKTTGKGKATAAPATEAPSTLNLTKLGNIDLFQILICEVDKIDELFCELCVGRFHTLFPFLCATFLLKYSLSLKKFPASLFTTEHPFVVTGEL